jgi:hypothetical protein
MKKLYLLMFSLILLTACQNFERSSDSGYGVGSARPKTKTVYSSGGQLTAESFQHFPKNQKINYLEKRLKSRSEKEHYSRVLPWFESDDERLEYLLLIDLERKEAWTQNKSIWNRSGSPTEQSLTLIKNQDIAMGMPREYVKRSWGEPQNVDVSGDPLFLNERWKYMKQVSSTQGYRQEKKVVYFEGGKVVGWSTD